MTHDPAASRIEGFRPTLVIISAPASTRTVPDPSRRTCGSVEADFCLGERKLMEISRPQGERPSVVSLLEGGYDLEGLASVDGRACDDCRWGMHRGRKPLMQADASEGVSLHLTTVTFVPTRTRL